MRASNLFEHIRNICERPGMFAPGFSLEHLHLFIHGYEMARRDAELPSPYTRFEEWLYAQHPEWSPSSKWWAKHLLDACGGDLDRTLSEIIGLMNRFLATEGAASSSKTS